MAGVIYQKVYYLLHSMSIYITVGGIRVKIEEELVNSMKHHHTDFFPSFLFSLFLFPSLNS